MYSEKATKVSEIFSHLTFEWHYIEQKLGEDFAKFCGLLRIYELYKTESRLQYGNNFWRLLHYIQLSIRPPYRHIGGKKLTYKIERKESFQRRKSGVWTLF